jgi:hypothetical protein
VPIVEPGPTTLRDTIVADAEGVVWVVANPAPPHVDALWRWDAATGQKRPLGPLACCQPIFGDGTEIFHVEYRPGETAFLATSIRDGAVRLVRTISREMGTTPIVAVDAKAIYFVSPAANVDLGVLAKTGNEPPGIIPGARVPFVGVVSDETHLYWIEQGNGTGTGSSLFRLEKATGRRDAIVQSPILWPGLAVDACNVYYTASTSPAVYARGK